MNKRPTDDQNHQIGQRIRDIRKRQGHTLRDLSKETELSVPYLSQIENGQVNLNLINLETIARFLNIPLITLFVSDDLNQVSVTRRSERRWFQIGNEARESLLLKVRGNLEIFTIHLPVGADTERFSQHAGEEFTYVLKGSVRIDLENHPSYDLEVGDIIYYLSEIPHLWRNLGQDEAEILVVNTPPTY